MPYICSSKDRIAAFSNYITLRSRHSILGDVGERQQLVGTRLPGPSSRYVFESGGSPKTLEGSGFGERNSLLWPAMAKPHVLTEDQQPRASHDIQPERQLSPK
jgi:hypothetical protein